jgi:hypothetical protein
MQRRMSVLFAACVVAVGVLALVPAMASAKPVGGIVVHVHDGFNANVSVVVSPTGGTAFTLTGQASTLVGKKDGEITFSSSRFPNPVPKGSSATVTATLGSDSFAPFQGNPVMLTSNVNTFELHKVSVSVVPEFGAVAAGAAVLLSVVAFVFIRRRRLAAAH